MSESTRLSDSQWHTLLAKMSSRQQMPPAHPHGLPQPSLHHGHASNPGLTDFNTLNFNPAVNATFDPTANFSEADFPNLAANMPAHHFSTDETSMAELQKITKELEGVKER